MTGQAVATSRGYDLEALIPWDAFDVTADQLADNMAFGFNLSINDNDGSEPAQQTVLSSSAARTTYDNPSQWGTLVLLVPPAATPTNTVTVVPTDRPTAAPTSTPSPLVWLAIPSGDFTLGSSAADMEMTLGECNATEGQTTGRPC
ncbi:MAG: sugar-binding protein, partial [Anaerolineae bacterium]